MAQRRRKALRILITGAAGFIGSHVALAYRAEGHEVIGIDNLSTGNRVNLPTDFDLHVLDITEDQRVHEVVREFRPTRVRKELGWKPQISFREGVRRVVEYWKNKR